MARVSPYGTTSVLTGQSEPNMHRSGPKRESHPGRITLLRELDVPGVRRLVQSFTLAANDPVIRIDVELELDRNERPQALYLAIPRSTSTGWRGLFDSAGATIALGCATASWLSTIAPHAARFAQPPFVWPVSGANVRASSGSFAADR
jgi:hypothetical protein